MTSHDDPHEGAATSGRERVLGALSRSPRRFAAAIGALAGLAVLALVLTQCTGGARGGPDPDDDSTPTAAQGLTVTEYAIGVAAAVDGYFFEHQTYPDELDDAALADLGQPAPDGAAVTVWKPRAESPPTYEFCVVDATADAYAYWNSATRTLGFDEGDDCDPEAPPAPSDVIDGTSAPTDEPSVPEGPSAEEKTATEDEAIAFRERLLDDLVEQAGQSASFEASEPIAAPDSLTLRGFEIIEGGAQVRFCVESANGSWASFDAGDSTSGQDDGCPATFEE